MIKYEVRNKGIQLKLPRIGSFMLLLFSFLLLAPLTVTTAQVKATIDSTSILIGQEIRYTMQVEADASELVVFPEGQTFQPLEVLETFNTDTLKNEAKHILTKEYALTQFDSGSYTIPRQKILIADKVFYTDSLNVEVRNVVVDTTKQKMYAIKPLVEVDPPLSIDWMKWLLWIGIPLLIAAAIVFILLKRKQIKNKKEEDLPAYERAMLSLQRIDSSQLLEQDSHKEYYSQLSDTARKYIDEEVYDHAMESTTDELIQRLDQEIKTGSLKLDKATIEELKQVLKTADLVKFAKSRPDILSAKKDRKTIEEVITKTKEAIPEPTEEELLADEEFRKTLQEKRRTKRILIGFFAFFGAFLITLVIFIAVKGYDVVKDNILGHPTKELVESEWITSSYGTPPVSISTPKVLIRNDYKMTEEQKQVLKGNESFVYGSILGNFFVTVSTVSYKQQNDVDLEKAVEGTVGYLESKGAKNITVKNEEFETLGGAKGIKVFGNFQIKNSTTQETQKNEYVILNFAEQGGFQQITITFDEEDRYAEDLVNRIINSVELRNNE
ncbi:DUF4381 domain-containing protein [Aquimarina brevivitae]|uniref:DUF4381 domain-containing protein n=1 Tax=Aquimarina brevivitae TaxID=323412 RepID=A0A4Q7PHF6_9FLAO|nr:DUF4381 domain-containing protein [Aquimarina brevivitae]RZS99220.1 hypothetical protein EV197_0429 [Aquimarina brevivitae]